MIPTHVNALEVDEHGKKLVDRMQEAFFDVELLFTDSVTLENNPGKNMLPGERQPAVRVTAKLSAKLRSRNPPHPPPPG